MIKINTISGNKVNVTFVKADGTVGATADLKIGPSLANQDISALIGQELPKGYVAFKGALVYRAPKEVAAGEVVVASEPAPVEVPVAVEEPSAKKKTRKPGQREFVNYVGQNGTSFALGHKDQSGAFVNTGFVIINNKTKFIGGIEREELVKGKLIYVVLSNPKTYNDKSYVYANVVGPVIKRTQTTEAPVQGAES